MDIFAVSGRIKSLEKTFLTADGISRAVQSKNFAEFSGMLAGTPYDLPQNPAGPEEITSAFENVAAVLVSDMRKSLPEGIFLFFLLKYDFHNIRLLAGVNVTGPGQDNCSELSSIPCTKLKEAIESGNYKEIPAYLKGVLSRLSRGGGDGDLLLKKMYYATAAELLKTAGSSFVDRYLCIEVDFANIAEFITQKMVADKGKKIFLDGGNIMKERFENEEVLWNAVNTEYRKIDVPVDSGNYDVTRYGVLLAHLRAGRVVPYGIETAFAYFAGRQIEMDNLRRMALGKFYGLDPGVVSGWALPPY